MKIKTDRDITGPVAKELRTKLGLSQPAFWGPVGVKQSVASKYESGLRLPDSVRSMLFIRYVAGIEHSPSTQEGAQALRKLAAHQPQ